MIKFYKIGWFIVLIVLLALMVKAVPNYYTYGNMIVTYNTTSNQFCTGSYCANVSQLNASGAGGSGDITAVNTNGAYLYGGAATGAVSLLVNNTALTANLSCSAGDARVGTTCVDILRENELDSFSELDAQIADKTLLYKGTTTNTNDLCTWDGTGIDCSVDDNSTYWMTAYLNILANQSSWTNHGNGANCAAGSYPLGVDANGAIESCTDATTEIDSAILTHKNIATAHHTATVDTNESTRFGNLVGDCGAGKYLQNISTNGSKVCRTVTSGTSYTNQSPISLSGTVFGLMNCTNTQGWFFNSSIPAWECQGKTAGVGSGTVTSVTLTKPWLSGDEITSTGTVGFNETRMNATIDARSDFDTDTWNTTAQMVTAVNATGWVINWSGIGDTDTTYTAGDALTLTGTDFDFDGGASPGGELGGSWASPTVDTAIFDDEYIELGDNFVGDVTGTYGATVVGDGSHTHTYNNITAFTEANLYTILSDVSQFIEAGETINMTNTDILSASKIGFNHSRYIWDNGTGICIVSC